MIQEKQENHLQRIKEKVRTPEGVPRLFDLITVQDERIKLAFYAALGNTVVAKDLDQVDCILCLLFNGSTSLPLILFLSHRIVVQQLHCSPFTMSPRDGDREEDHMGAFSWLIVGYSRSSSRFCTLVYPFLVGCPLVLP